MANKVLDIKTLSDLSEKTYKTKEIKLKTEGQEFKVICQEKFRNTEVQELVVEWLAIREASLKKGVEVNMYTITYILILKHFTDVPFEDITDVLERTEHYIRMANLLVDLKDEDGQDFFNKILFSLDLKEIDKVSQAMEVASDILLDEAKKNQEKVAD